MITRVFRDEEGQYTGDSLPNVSGVIGEIRYNNYERNERIWSSIQVALLVR
jgi:hypothetical protein